MTSTRSSPGGRPTRTSSRTSKTASKSATYGPAMISPHLVVRGADAAAAFYREALGAEELDRLPAPDGRVMSLQLRIGGTVVHLADEFPEMDVLAPPSVGGTAVVLALEVE